MYFFNVAGACAIARKIERYQTLLRAWEILLIRLPTKQKIMAIKATPLPPDAKSRMIPSFLGYLGVIGAFVTPKESFVTVERAIAFTMIVYAGFFALFTFLPTMFFKDNFSKPPKDNFGELFMVMFGFQGFGQLYLIHIADKHLAFPAVCAINAGICYVGPQRGEILNAPNVLPNHIVPHAGLLLCSIALLSTLP